MTAAAKRVELPLSTADGNQDLGTLTVDVAIMAAQRSVVITVLQRLPNEPPNEVSSTTFESMLAKVTA